MNTATFVLWNILHNPLRNQKFRFSNWKNNPSYSFGDMYFTKIVYIFLHIWNTNNDVGLKIFYEQDVILIKIKNENGPLNVIMTQIHSFSMEFNVRCFLPKSLHQQQMIKKRAWSIYKIKKKNWAKSKYTKCMPWPTIFKKWQSTKDSILEYIEIWTMHVFIT